MSTVSKEDITRLNDKIDELNERLGEFNLAVALLKQQQQFDGAPGKATVCLTHAEKIQKCEAAIDDITTWRTQMRGFVLGVSFAAGVIGSVVTGILLPLIFKGWDKLGGG